MSNIYALIIAGVNQKNADCGCNNKNNNIQQNGLQKVLAVSYTHLDVYKRQVTEKQLLFPLLLGNIFVT